MVLQEISPANQSSINIRETKHCLLTLGDAPRHPAATTVRDQERSALKPRSAEMKVDWSKPHGFIWFRHGPRGFCGAEGLLCIMLLATSETALTLMFTTASSVFKQQACICVPAVQANIGPRVQGPLWQTMVDCRRPWIGQRVRRDSGRSCFREVAKLAEALFLVVIVMRAETL